MKKTYITSPSLPELEEFIPYLEKIWDNKWLTNNGEFHQLFEKELADFLGVKYVSLFTNGTLALITALQALRITGEVITTPYSFVATTHSLYWNGIRPVFADIEPNSFNIDPKKIEAAITQKTTAILPVHVYGVPCNIEEINELAAKYGLKVIYDAAHAFNVKYKGNSVLNFGDLSVLSFHATKVFNTFEGGAIISHDAKTKERIDYLKNFGFADELTVVGPGINAKMNEFQSALGLLQIKRYDTSIEKRKQIFNYYFEMLSGLEGIELLHPNNDYSGNYSYFPILINKEVYGLDRDEVYELYKAKDIYTRRYFYPLISHFPIYRALDSAKKENLYNAERVSGQVLCLPLFENLEMDTAKLVCDVLINKA